MSLALDTHTILDSLRPPRAAVRRRLAAVRRRIRARTLLVGFTWTWTTLFLFAAASLTGDWFLRLSLPVRASIAAAALVLVAAVAWRRLVTPLLVRLDDFDLAALIDRRCPGVGQRVASVLQLPQLIEGRVTASPSMVQAAVMEQAQVLERTDLGAALDARVRGRMLLLLVITASIVAGFVYRFPDAAELWARRWLLGSNERWPQHNYLALVGLGDGSRLLAPRGESLLLEVDAAPNFAGESGNWSLPGRGETLQVTSPRPPQPATPETVSIRYWPADGPMKEGNFTRYSEARFRYEIPQVSEPFDVSISGGDDWFGPVRVEPVDRPTVQSLVVYARRPGREETETHSSEGGDSQLLFLPDTELLLEVTSSVPLSGARLTAKEGPAPPLERKDQTHYAAHWTMKQAQTFELNLIGLEGGLASKPYFVSIGLLIDREPRVSIRSSGVGRRVTSQARIPLALHAADDFGITAVTVEMEATSLKDDKPQTKSQRIAVELPPFSPDAPPTEIDQQPSFSLSEQLLAPGTLLKLRGQASDNRIQGPQSGTSRWLSFQVVTPEELFYEILMRQRAERAKFAAALDMAKTQTEPLAVIPTAEAAYGLVRKHQVVARQVWQVANRLEISLTEMALNDLGSEQARDLLQTKVIGAIRQLHGDPMTRLRVALEAVASGPKDAVEPLAEARELQAEVVDTMTKILEQMAQWENFVDVLNQLKAIVKLQSGVLEATEEEKKKRTQELFDD
ncbi:MAG TPA: hypothetical protein VFI31_25145 [Pirellulales bacterium]|nr:hypothetical protein [Pirellulales bacterium]